MVVGGVLGTAVEWELVGELCLISSVNWHWALPKGHLLPLPLTWSKDPKELFNIIQIMGSPQLPMPTPCQSASCLWLCCGTSPRNKGQKGLWNQLRICKHQVLHCIWSPELWTSLFVFHSLWVCQRGAYTQKAYFSDQMSSQTLSLVSKVLQGYDSSPPEDEVSIWRNKLHHRSICFSPETEGVPGWHVAVPVGGHVTESHLKKADLPLPSIYCVTVHPLLKICV